MERRNFLGIAALLGLSPMLPRNVFTEEQGAPGIVKAKTFDGEEVEFGEPLILDDEFKIKVADGKMEIIMPENEEDVGLLIRGKGWLENSLVDFEIEQISKHPIKATVMINKDKNHKHELININGHRDIPDIYIEGWSEPTVPHPMFYPPMTVEIICRK